VAFLVGAGPETLVTRSSDRARALEAAQAEATRLAAERVVAAAHLRLAEAATADALTKLDAISERRRVAERRMVTRTEDLAPLLPLIERLSTYPAETLLAVPATPMDALRGVLVLRGISRQIEHDAEAVRADQAQLDALTQEQTAATKRLKEAQAQQAAQAAALDQQLAEAQRVIDAAAADPSVPASEHAANQAAHAANLRSAIVTLETERQADELRAEQEAARAAQQKREAEAADAKRRAVALAMPAGPGLASPSGQLTAPVAGTIARGFGDPSDAGPATGLSYRAPPNARVVSPCGGRIVFSGPFRSFGLLLIVDCGGGYHFVMAGLDRLDVQVGRQVQPGEPVGVMPSWDPGSVGDRPALYVELRHDGIPVNPTPWLRAASEISASALR
jgi:septal ring factor EnvC (AmiA/AmiB activator)